MNTLEYVGACAYLWKAPAKTYLPDRLWRATIKENANPIYLWISLIQDKAKEQIRTMSSGTSGSMKNISIPRFLSVKIKKAPLPLQQAFAKRIEAIEKQKQLISSEIKDLETLLASRMQYWFD
jgi:type I restriction enzyme S subunit